MFEDFLHQLVNGPSFIGLAVQCWRALEAMGLKEYYAVTLRVTIFTHYN